MRLFGNLKRIWIRVTGSTAEFPLETRIFHSLCVVAIAALAYNVPFNYLIGLPYISIISLVTLIVFSFLYYRSRYMGKMGSTFVMFAITAHVLFIANFFFNSGINGPTDILMGLSLLLVLCVAPKSQQKFWLILNIAVVVALHTIQYRYPELAPDTYRDLPSRYFDMASAYIVVVVVIYFTITYLRRNYDHEKKIAADRAASIEEKNHQIVDQNHQLERINVERNKLMSIIAHDLRSPLSNIQNYLELVTEYDLDTDERRMVEGDLLKVTRRTIDMLGKLLMWSKAQMDGVNVKLSYVSLRESLFNTFELEKAIAAKKNISLTSEVDWDIKIVADSDMLQLVIRNLINNAIKFTPHGGQIDFKAKKIGRECWLIIRDNGIGIPPAKQAELFSLRAASTFGTDNEKGVGLGLLLCKEFTELQGGRIWVESPESEGTVFYVSMPAGH